MADEKPDTYKAFLALHPEDAERVIKLVSSREDLLPIEVTYGSPPDASTPKDKTWLTVTIPNNSDAPPKFFSALGSLSLR